MAIKDKKDVSVLLEAQIPEFVTSEHPKFKYFIEKYYEFMESQQVYFTGFTFDEDRLVFDSTDGSADAGDKILYEDGVGLQLESDRDTANTLWTGCKIQDANGVAQVYRTSGQDRILVDSDVGTVTYTSGKMSLVGFYPIAIGSVSTGNTTPLEVSVVPSSSDVLPLREQIILIEEGDITITMVDDAGTGTYVLGSSTSADGTTLITGT